MRALPMQRLALAALLSLAACSTDDGSGASTAAPAATEPPATTATDAARATLASETPSDEAARPTGEVAPPEPAESPAASDAAPAAPEGRTVAVRVTAEGFVPGRITLPVGVASQLVFTRTSDATCATSVQSAALGIAETDLPLGEAVTVHVMPARAGDLTFACSMDMVTGAVVAQNPSAAGS